MPRTPPNKPIGKCPCPVRNCELQCEVFEFRARPNEVNRRFAGKRYAVCETHGRFGGDPKDAGMQEYLRKHVAADPKASAAPPPPPPAPDVKKNAGGGTPPPAETKTPKAGGFGFFS